MPTLRPVLRFATPILAALALLLVAAPARAGNAMPLLKLIPDDVQVVAALNLAKARGTPLFRKGLELAARGAGDSWKKLEAAKIDPAKDLDTVLVAAQMTSDEPRVCVVIEGRLTGLLGELRKAKSVLQQGLETWDFGEHGALVVDKKVIFCHSPLLPAVVETLKGKRGNLKASKRAKPLRAAVAAVDARGDGWAAVLGSAFSKDLPVPGQVAWAAISLATSTGLAVEMKISADAEATASSWASAINEQLPTVKPLLETQGFGSMADSIEARNTGALLEVSLLLTDGEVSKALSYLARQAGVAGDAKSP